MTRPNWSLVDTVTVNAQPEGIWNLAIEFVPGPRLLRFRVVEKDKNGTPAPLLWTVNGTVNPALVCSPEGLLSSDAKTSYLCPGAALGALVGKLGGSTSDIPDPSQAAAPFGTGKRVFPIGSHCIIAMLAADSGPLYLTMNDEFKSFQHHAGTLQVEISDAPA